MSDEELIKETMMLDYSQLVMNCVYEHKENKRLNNIIKELEKFTNARIQKCYDEGCYIEEFNIYNEYASKIKELRGDSK